MLTVPSNGFLSNYEKVFGLLFCILRDMNNAKWCNGLSIEFRQSFAKETFSYDEYLKS